MQSMTLHNPVLPGATYCAAFDPTSEHLLLISRPMPNRVTVREVAPFPGAVRAGVPTEYSAEEFMDRFQHISVCLALEPRFRATHLYFRGGDVCAIKLLGDSIQEFGDVPANRFEKVPDDQLVQLLFEGIEREGHTDRIVLIKWSDPARFTNEAELL